MKNVTFILFFVFITYNSFGVNFSSPHKEIKQDLKTTIKYAISSIEETLILIESGETTILTWNKIQTKLKIAETNLNRLKPKILALSVIKDTEDESYRKASIGGEVLMSGIVANRVWLPMISFRMYSKWFLSKGFYFGVNTQLSFINFDSRFSFFTIDGAVGYEYDFY